MERKIVLCVIMFWLSTTCMGCTAHSWYEGVKETKRQDCYKLQSASERNRCLEEVDGASYDQYKRERDQMIKENGEK